MKIKHLGKYAFIDLYSQRYDPRFSNERFAALVEGLESTPASRIESFASKVPSPLFVAVQPIVSRGEYFGFRIDEYKGLDEWFLAFPANGRVYGYKVKETHANVFLEEQDADEEEDEENNEHADYYDAKGDDD